MGLNTAITDVAAKIAADLNSGSPVSRQSLGGGGVAFGWASGAGLPRTIASYSTVTSCEGMSFPITTVTESGTPAAKVAAGAAKPVAATITSSSVALDKHAGMATARLEDFLNAEGLASAIASVLGASCLQSFETDAIAQLDAATGATAVTGADWVAAVAAGQAAVLSNGGAPSVLAISAADYGAFLADVSASAGFSINPDSPVGSIFGSLIHVSSGAPAGKAFLFDAAAVIAVQHVQSPIAIVDAVSKASTNETQIVVDLVAKAFVVNAALVSEITAPA